MRAPGRCDVTAELLLLGTSALVFYVLGQIWFAQRVMYPLFARVPDGEAASFHRAYAARIPWPVIAPGFASFVAPIPLALLGPPVPAWMSVVNVAAGLGSAAVTIVLLIPRHARLERARDARVLAELVRYNWPRTLCVTAQALVSAAMLLDVLGRT